METSTSLLNSELVLNDSAKNYLKGAAKWQKFLAWVNIIILGSCIIFLLFGSNLLINFFINRSAYSRNADQMSTGFTIIFVMYAIIYAIILLPNIWRLIFANKCIKALDSNDEYLLSESFRNLKIYSTFWGILSVIGIVFFVLGIIGMVIALNNMH